MAPKLRPALLSVAVPTAATGLWALLAPSSWYSNFPGFGREWLPAFGPYNEHFARDIGSALLALGALLAIGALAPRTPVRRVAPAVFLAWAVPHLAYHVAEVGALPAGDDVVNLVLLTLTVLIPAAALLASGDGTAPRRTTPSGPDGWRLPPAPSSGLLRRGVFAYTRRRFGHVIGPLAVAAHNKPVLAGYSAFESALERADSVDRRLEELASMRASMLTGCGFCIDFGSALVAQLGISDEKLAALPDWRSSGAFGEDERLVLEYADALETTPVQVSDELFGRLRARFDEAAIVELTAAIAFEYYRGRFNHALGLGSEGFCDAQNGRPAAKAMA